MSIEQVIDSYPGVFGLLTFFAGLILGNWLAIGRDKRKEFNDAALPIREWLLAEIANPHPPRNKFSNVELDQFMQRLPAIKRVRFANAYEEQKVERKKIQRRDSMGGVFYDNPVHLIAALKRCLVYTKLK